MSILSVIIYTFEFTCFSDVNKLKNVLNEMVEAVIEEFLKPHENSLTYRSN